MDGDFVTVATYGDPMEAEMARNRLEAEGIRALLMDRETVAMAWQLTQAIGGVKLLVSLADEERAETILEGLLRKRPQLTEDDDDDESQAIVADADKDKIEPVRDESGAIVPENDVDRVAATSDEAEDEDDPPTERELDAERAIKSQIFAFLFFPLQLYALMCILTVASSQQRLDGHYLRRFRLAVALHAALWLVALIFLMVLAR